MLTESEDLTKKENEELKEKIAELEKKVERLNKAIKNQRYGLNWIDVEEEFEKDSKDKIPVLKEVKDKAIENDDGKPTHMLIEGDNYHALTCLNYTHKGKIDVIYIDPPYNTGNDGFTYRDKRLMEQWPDGTTVPVESPLRHSYWLSFMNKRLELAKELLSDRGVIFISIDDNEQANLKLLCDKVFGEKNFVGNIPTIMNLKGNQDEFGFAGTHEYTLVYAKKYEECKFKQLPIDEEDMNEWIIDEKGYYKKGANLKSTGINAPKEKRPYLFYPILIDRNQKISSITDEEYIRIYNPSDKSFDLDYIEKLKQSYTKNGYRFVLPITDGLGMSWRWSRNKVLEERNDIIVNINGNEISIYKKQRPQLGDLPSKKPKSIFYKPEYSSGNGKAEVVSVFGESLFGYPKPIELMKDFIIIGSEKSSTILDFFAGSGTTLHATMKLNEEDGGKRQCILVQLNENDICEKVTYERNRRVMQGYKNNKGEQVGGIGNSLKYYKTGFVGKHASKDANDEDKIELAKEANCLLALAENTLYENKTEEKYQIYTDNKKRWTAIYFSNDAEDFPKMVKDIEEIQKDKDAEITVYVLSWGDVGIYENEFDNTSGINLKAIPQPILDIYKALNV